MTNDNTWLPISTAPKDGRPILLCVGKIVGSGRRRSGNLFVGCPLDFYFDGASLPSEAKYWMPLPKPYNSTEDPL